MNRNIILLALSQAAMMTVISLTLASSALVSTQLASPSLATIPLAIQYLGTLIMLYPVAWLMRRIQRRLTFCLGALAGAIGLTGAAVGIKTGSFTLFTASCFLIGIFGAVGQYYRFAAADAVQPTQKSLAISLTLAGGLLAAVAGPALAQWTKDLLEPAFYISFLCLAGIAMLGALFAIRLDLPPLAQTRHQHRWGLWSSLANNPKLMIAILGGVVGYAIMNLLMTATPLAMHRENFSFAATASVIQWHLVAMFAPSFFTGALIQRIGVTTVMLLGCLLSLASIAVNLSGQQLIHFQSALILLGVGWNFLYVGATALLAESCHKEQTTQFQALNDTFVFAGVTGVTLFSGTLVNLIGWNSLNLYAGLPVLVVVVALMYRMVLRPKSTVQTS